MSEYDILVDRTAVQSMTIRVTADNLDEAMEKAEEEAPNHDFTGTGNGAEYEALEGTAVNDDTKENNDEEVVNCQNVGASIIGDQIPTEEQLGCDVLTTEDRCEARMNTGALQNVEVVIPDSNAAKTEIKCGRCGRCCSKFTLGGDGRWLWNPYGTKKEQQVELLRRILIPIDIGTKTIAQWYKCRMLHMNSYGEAECLIYDARPDICRSFSPGDLTCSDEAPCSIERERRRIHSGPETEEMGVPS